MRFICLRYPKIEMTYKTEVIREVNGVIIKQPTRIIKFNGGEYKTNDKDEIEFIKRHVDFRNGNICVDESSIYQEKIETPRTEPAEIEKPKRGRKKKE